MILSEFVLSYVFRPRFIFSNNLYVTGDVESNEIHRKISSDHPSKVSFPGLPTHAHSMKTQTIQVYDEEKKMIIKEVNDFEGIPYADYFSVIIHWYVFDINNGDSFECDVKIMLGFQFHKSTWLASTIESNTRAELKGVYEMWLEEAMRRINSLNHASHVSPVPSPTKEMLMDSRENSSHGIRNRSHSAYNAQHYNYEKNSAQSATSSGMSSPKQRQGRKTPLSGVHITESNNFIDVENGMGYSGGDENNDKDDDDESLEFFDCEEDTSMFESASFNTYHFRGTQSMAAFQGEKFQQLQRHHSFDQFNVIPHVTFDN